MCIRDRFKTSQGFLKNHIKPQIGGIPLADLTSLDLQRFYKHLRDGGRVDRIEAKKKPKGLAPKTVRNLSLIHISCGRCAPKKACPLTRWRPSTPAATRSGSMTCWQTWCAADWICPSSMCAAFL